MAEQLEMSEAQLSQLIGKKQHKAIGNELARRVEAKLGLPHGWLDTENHDLSTEAVNLAREYQNLSLDQKRAIQAVLKSFKK